MAPPGPSGPTPAFADRIWGVPEPGPGRCVLLIRMPRPIQSVRRVQDLVVLVGASYFSFSVWLYAAGSKNTNNARTVFRVGLTHFQSRRPPQGPRGPPWAPMGSKIGQKLNSSLHPPQGLLGSCMRKRANTCEMGPSFSGIVLRPGKSRCVAVQAPTLAAFDGQHTLTPFRISIIMKTYACGTQRTLILRVLHCPWDQPPKGRPHRAPLFGIGSWARGAAQTAQNR